jgi:hypothetical protein
MNFLPGPEYRSGNSAFKAHDHYPGNVPTRPSTKPVALYSSSGIETNYPVGRGIDDSQDADGGDAADIRINCELSFALRPEKDQGGAVFAEDNLPHRSIP